MIPFFPSSEPAAHVQTREGDQLILELGRARRIYLRDTFISASESDQAALVERFIATHADESTMRARYVEFGSQDVRFVIPFLFWLGEQPGAFEAEPSLMSVSAFKAHKDRYGPAHPARLSW